MRGGLFLLIVLVLLSLTSAAHITLKWNEPSYLHTRIYVGDTVTWIASDNSKPHTITSTDNTNELDSEIISTYPSQSFSHTFTKPGIFHYSSKFNTTDMLGTIVVTQSDLSGGVQSISGLFLAAVLAALLVFVIS
eukprot:Phypoly_transcript_17051.p1 GENE.Phypoly_transcript_17051~~Phypoly_transcript_17051.p1  ORF type:complete len:135 (+),score=11.59 Phypoly_transcript_17051:179-583(+)